MVMVVQRAKDKVHVSVDTCGMRRIHPSLWISAVNPNTGSSQGVGSHKL